MKPAVQPLSSRRISRVYPQTKDENYPQGITADEKGLGFELLVLEGYGLPHETIPPLSDAPVAAKRSSPFDVVVSSIVFGDLNEHATQRGPAATASLFQFGVHRDVGAQRPRNQTVGFGADRGINEFALSHFGQPGDNVQMDIHDGPTCREEFQGHRRRSDNLARRNRFQSQFIRQRQGKTARVSGGNQFGRIGMGTVIFERGAQGEFGLLQHAALGRHRAGAAFGAAFPMDRSLPNNQVHQDSFGPEPGMNQYFVS